MGMSVDQIEDAKREFSDHKYEFYDFISMLVHDQNYDGYDILEVMAYPSSHAVEYADWLDAK